MLSHVHLCDPMDYSPPGSSVPGIFQARILEWVVISFSRESLRPRDQTWVRASLVAQLVKNLPARQETPVQFLGREDSPGEGRGYALQYSWASLAAQLVKNSPAMQEILVQFLGGEDPLKKEQATHSSVLAWRIPGAAEPGGLPSMGSHRVGHN